MQLRDYQQAAFDAAITHLRTSVAPGVIEAATGAGKSHIIAAIAHKIFSMSGKRILCIAPSAELVIQNYNKYLLTGSPASKYSASAGRKCLKHPIVFGTPVTIANNAKKLAAGLALIIVDEAQNVTPTLRKIVDEARAGNPNIRLLGLTATPYRMFSGHIYAMGLNNNATGAIDPYYDKLIYQIKARELIERGYLVPIRVGNINEHYNTLGMVVGNSGKFNNEDVDRAYHGHGRKTAAIVADIVRQSADRRGVIIYCATVQHAQEAFASLPPGLSCIITGETPPAERKQTLSDFTAQRIKYAVNVGVLTVGVDVPHVDVIAVLRASESQGLFEQIKGRGMRLYPGKKDCLLLDYAENIERHYPSGDIYEPEITTGRIKKESVNISVTCPQCGVENTFSARENKEGFGLDKYGFFLDLAGNRIETEFGPLPSHHGRRCQGIDIRAVPVIRCSYRWTFKECPTCGADNDIAARRCASCKGEIVDPNEKLVADFKKFKKDPTQVQTDKLVAICDYPSISRSGNDVTRVDVTTEYRTFSVWFVESHKQRSKAFKLYEAFKSSGAQAKTITYRMAENGFYSILAFDQPEDKAP